MRSRSETALIWLLRFSAAVLLGALVPVVMPHAWMDAIHRALGMGELPETPLTGYLTRSLSLFYAYHGGLLLFISFDVRRYLPLVQCLAGISLAFGVALLAIDAAVGMPTFWTAAEGPFVVLLSVVLFALARKSGER